MAVCKVKRQLFTPRPSLEAAVVLFELHSSLAIDVLIMIIIMLIIMPIVSVSLHIVSH